MFSLAGHKRNYPSTFEGDPFFLFHWKSKNAIKLYSLKSASNLRFHFCFSTIPQETAKVFTIFAFRTIQSKQLLNY